MKTKRFFKLNDLISGLLMILLIGVIVLSTYVTKRTQDSIDTITQRTVQDAGKIVVGHINSYFDPLVLYNKVAMESWDPNKDFMTQAIEKEGFARRLVAHYPHIESLQYGDQNGNFVMYRKDNQGNINTKIVFPDVLTPKEKAKPRVIWRYFKDDLMTSEVIIDGVDYDPRTRPWYIGAKDIDALYMTEPYQFFTGGALGITAAHRLYSNQNFYGVYSFDVRLDNLISYVNTLDLTVRGETFLVTENQTVIGKFEVPLSTELVSGVLEPLPGEYLQIIKDKRFGEAIPIKIGKNQSLVVFHPILSDFSTVWHVGLRIDESLLNQSYRLNARLSQVLSVLLIILTSLLLFYRHRQSATHQYLDDLARHDQLTGLLNRHSFEALSELLMKRYQEQGDIFSILIGDIDNFKRLNDTFGHGVGDEVLVALADVFSHHIRETDFACRWGGEEFLIVLPNLNQDAAKKVAQSLLRRIEFQQLSTQVGVISITMSFGLATVSPEETMVSLINRADGYLYQAKSKGRNCVVGQNDD